MISGITFDGNYDEINEANQNDIENLKNLVASKIKKHSNLPVINFHYVINKYNTEEIIPFIDLVKSIIKAKVNIFDTTIYARKCKIKEVSSKETIAFLTEIS